MVGYVTIEEADAYVATHFLSTDELRTSWNKLTNDDKTILLLKSFESIELLPYRGRKTGWDQTTAFPRCPDTAVPDSVKAAQIENAVVLDSSDATEDAAYYQRLWQFGVESYKIGNLSEKIGAGAWSSGPGIAAASGIVSAKAVQLLLPYMRGGYSIQGTRHPPQPRKCGATHEQND